jgi:hypothetical protein
MTAYGIVAEGYYDEKVLGEIINKILGREITLISRRGGDKDHLIKIFPVHLKEFLHANEGYSVDKAIVIRDAHGRDPAELKERMKSKILNQRYTFEVKFIIIIQELEGWLLSDEKAISRVTMSHSGKPAVPVNKDIESITEAKETLAKVLSNAKVVYTDSVAQEIARESDLEKIKYRCPSFGEFWQAVIDC